MSPSPMRKTYLLRLVLRCLILVGCVLLHLCRPESFSVLEGMNFFREFSLLHLLWITWVADMVLQLIPARGILPLGSQKYFRNRFSPVDTPADPDLLKKEIRRTSKAALGIFLLWVALTAFIGFLFHRGILDRGGIFLLSVVFYVCDLICVLIWCPFRLMLKNRCCTTCRIFNWDHLMMFSPYLFVKSFYTTSLLLFSILVWAIWEITILRHPERFWPQTNKALQCSQCTDKLCTQYCGKHP